MSLPVVKTPTDFPFTHTGQPDKLGQSLGGDFADVQDKFDSRAIFNQTQINAIITALNSIVDGDSGADNVSATPIPGGTANTTQGILEELYTLTQTLLPFPDGSVTNAKLATDVKVGSLAASTSTDKSSVIAITNELDSTKAELSAFNTHVADLATDVDGVHGIIIETGAWTPYIFGTTTAGTNTYSVQTGKYTRINKRVIAECTITLTAKDAAMAGSIRIGGLPFSAKDTINNLIFSILTNVPLPTNAYQATGYINASFGILAFNRNNLTQIAFTPTEINNNTSMTVVMNYEIN